MAQIVIKKDFIEYNEAGFARKRDNFLDKAPQLVTDGLLPKESTDSIIQKLQADKTRCDQKNADQKIARDSRTIYAAGHSSVEKSLREYKKIIDLTPGITPELKLELGLVNESKVESTTYKKPDLKGKEVGGIPHISFTKFPMDGIMLYGKINDGNYDFQTSVKGSYFEDTRPRINSKIAEVREYYAYYTYAGKKVGKQSEIIRVVLNPIE
ncbi:hypothetical protein [Labilibaculum euxinus]|uniref:Uncharacterized protein n=1 Tax=Labilibaculum euxinus TaxID=2686357 RepID=A0A7M4DBN6_9BACT|nr:hypothetical protein [Labilibaculum euxinus]MUP40065.1 hypothetical protein [Labilibaculum euxinus]MVB09270.1 hypothetical protein [Labilibaculum euxinus]